MFIISINHKNSDIDIRAKYAFDEAKSLAFLESLKARGLDEAVYVSTCNRVEVFGEGDMYVAIKALAEFSGQDSSEIKEIAYFYEGKKAINYLFRVIAGFESMVLGEDEILHQLKDAYVFSQNNGFTGYKLNAIFQAAIASAKRVKTETLISKSSVSVATIAAAKCHYFKKGHKNILVMGGSGDTGKKTIKNLLSYEDCTIYATVRNKHVLDKNVVLVEYEDRYDYVDRADIIISATKSPKYTIVHSLASASIKEDKQRLFVDLAVPRDIDEEVLNIKHSELLTINEIEELARENNQIKMAQVELAEEILDEEIDELLKAMEFHAFLPVLKDMDQCAYGDLQRFIYKYRDIAKADEFQSFVNVLKRMEEAE